MLIFGVFCLTKPIVNFVYGDNLFVQQCEIKQVSLAKIQELLDARKKQLGKSGNADNYEIFNIIDSGIVISVDNQESDF